jgi:hypothetical protein
MPSRPRENPEGETVPAHKHQTWRSRPIFLSSTFRDMHAERDYLRTHVFSELEERLRERSHYLETIDLRQGVETAGERDVGQREMKVLRVCLDEIDRCKPFFVGLIGDRYGWIPPAERMQAAAERIQFADERTGFTASVAGRSVTELEFLYGVLENRREDGLHSIRGRAQRNRVGVPLRRSGEPGSADEKPVLHS